jgi:hypothetical protein
VNRPAAVVAANLLVPAGVLVFGWNAAAAAFLIWLDTLLYSLTLGALGLAAARRSFAPPPEMQRQKAGWWAGIGLGMLFVAPVFFAPPVVLGLELHDALRRHFPQGPLAAAFADRAIYLWIVLALVIRSLQVSSLAREILGNAALVESIGARAADQLLGLVLRAVILIHLAWLVAWFGRPGLLVFLFAASAFLAYTELHEDWVRRGLRRLQRWEARLKERARNRASP